MRVVYPSHRDSKDESGTDVICPQLPDSQGQLLLLLVASSNMLAGLHASNEEKCGQGRQESGPSWDASLHLLWPRRLIIKFALHHHEQLFHSISPSNYRVSHEWA